MTLKVSAPAARTLIALSTVFALGSTLAGCAGDGAESTTSGSTVSTGMAEADGNIITDSYGNKFELPVSFSKVIVLNTAVYEMIDILGKASTVVGVGDTVTGGNSAALKKYGDWREPNVEAILEAQPDVVFGYSSWLDDGVSRQLEQGGVRVAMIDLSQPSTMMNEIKFLGKLLGAEKKAAEFIDDVQGVLDDVAKRTKGLTPVTAYWEGYSDYSSVGPGSGGHELLGLAGVTNIMGKEGTEYPKASDEFILEANPQVIVKMVSSKEKALGPEAADTERVKALYGKLVARPGWQGIAAVQKKRVIMLPQEIGTNPLGMALVPLIVGKVAYPKAFADVSPEKVLDRLLRQYWHTTASGTWMYQG